MSRRRQGPIATDQAWWEEGDETPPTLVFDGHDLSSEYVSLSDGTRLAVDRYLPSGLAPGAKVTTLLCTTPYFRRFEFRFGLAQRIVARAFTGGGSNWWPTLARYGYATIVVEQRGCGASFGHRSLDPIAELKDMTDVVDWVVAQPWSDGRVVPIGVSAMGLTAELLLSSRHPAVVASVPMFAAFDLYTATHPGGLVFARSIENIGDTMRALDNNRIGEMSPKPVLRLLLAGLVRGLRPVDSDTDRTLLRQAVSQHVDNEYIDAGIIATEHRDDPMTGTSVEMTIDGRSPSTFAGDMRASGVPVMAYTGWWDSASALEALQLQASVPNPGSSVVIGPWGHAGVFQVGPERADKTPSRFDFAADVARFAASLDRVPAEDTGSTVHYFTMVEERWKTAASWPPDAVTVPYYFGPGGRLHAAPPGAPGADALRVDPTSGTGEVSRWALEKHPSQGVVYPDRRAQDARLMVFTADPASVATEITGHPVVRLFVSSSEPDGALAVYLEEVRPDGFVSYITEGLLRLSDRGADAGPPGYQPFSPRVPRRFARADARPLQPDEVSEVVLDLYPISYLLRAGSALRVAVGGGDADNFRVVGSGPSPTLRLHRGPGQQSVLELPVIPDD